MRLFSLFPLVIVAPVDGANARNWPSHIVIDPVKADASTFAEEDRERRIKAPFALAALAIVTVAGWLYGSDLAGDWTLAAGLALAVALLGWTRLPGFRRRLELAGNAAQIVVRSRLYGEPVMTAVEREAQRLRGGYGGLFDGFEVELMLLAELPSAGRFVDARLAMIERYRREVR